jgi:hypothetical protein
MCGSALRDCFSFEGAGRPDRGAYRAAGRRAGFLPGQSDPPQPYGIPLTGIPDTHSKSTRSSCYARQRTERVLCDRHNASVQTQARLVSSTPNNHAASPARPPKSLCANRRTADIFHYIFERSRTTSPRSGYRAEFLMAPERRRGVGKAWARPRHRICKREFKGDRNHETCSSWIQPGQRQDGQ